MSNALACRWLFISITSTINPLDNRNKIVVVFKILLNTVFISQNPLKPPNEGNIPSKSVKENKIFTSKDCHLKIRFM